MSTIHESPIDARAALSALEHKGKDLHTAIQQYETKLRDALLKSQQEEKEIRMTDQELELLEDAIGHITCAATDMTDVLAGLGNANTHLAELV